MRGRGARRDYDVHAAVHELAIGVHFGVVSARMGSAEALGAELGTHQLMEIVEGQVRDLLCELKGEPA